MAEKDLIFAARVRTLRENLGLSQKALAAQVTAFSLGSIQRAEVGLVPSSRILAAMARFYGVTVAWLLTGQGDRQPVPVDEGVVGTPHTDQIYGQTTRVQTDAGEVDVTLFADPRAPDPFAAAVAALRRIFDTADPITIQAINSQIQAAAHAAACASRVSHVANENMELRAELRRVRERLKALEERGAGETQGSPADPDADESH